MGKMCYFDLFLKTTQQPDESNKSKLAKWCPAAAAKPAGWLAGVRARCSAFSPISSSVHLLFIVRFRQIIFFSCLLSKPRGNLASIKLKLAFFLLQKENQRDQSIWNVFRMFGLIKITLQLGLFHLSYKSEVNFEMKSIASECKVIPFWNGSWEQKMSRVMLQCIEIF